jgi:hypothetical protein
MSASARRKIALSSTGAVGEDQAGEENCLKKLQVGKSTRRDGSLNIAIVLISVHD